MVIMCTLTYLCGRRGGESISNVSDFFESYNCYEKWSVDDFLSSEGNTNGEKALQAMLETISVACAHLNKHLK